MVKFFRDVHSHSHCEKLVLPKPRGPIGGADLSFISPQPDTAEEASPRIRVHCIACCARLPPVLIKRHRIDGTMSWRWYTAKGGSESGSLPDYYHTASSFENRNEECVYLAVKFCAKYETDYVTCAVLNDSLEWQRSRHYAPRSFVVNDVETTSVKISSLLSGRSYSVRVAARTAAGAGPSTEIIVDTRPFNVRTYDHNDACFACLRCPCSRGVSSCSSLGWPAGLPDLRLGARIPDDIMHD